MIKRPRFGDIIEIPLTDGKYGYAQYTHKHKMYGALLRVFNTKGKIEDVKDLVSDQCQFTTFFPLGAAVNQQVVSIVGNLPIRVNFQKFPVFKAGVPGSAGVVDVWWLWDGQDEVKVGELTAEQMSFPTRQVINDTQLVEYIMSNWKG